MPEKTVIDIMQEKAALAPDRTLFTFVDDAGHDEEALTYGQLTKSADAIGATLLNQHGIQRGDRVLLVYPQSLDFVRTLTGCMVAGIIPVPVYPPNPLNPGRSVALFAELAAICGAKAVLTNGEYSRYRQMGSVKHFFKRGAQNWPQLPWIRTDNIKSEGSQPLELDPPLNFDDIAFLQYTSGSTSTPKGVIVTYGNLDHQLTCNRLEAGFDEHSRSVFWVPQYHDFGLICGLMNGLIGNTSFHIMSPLSFVKEPAIWFDVLTRVRATHTAAPNFAFDLAVRKTTEEQRRRWDLRELGLVMWSAEPIQPGTVERFHETFALSGLRRESFCPAYGMAEHTGGISLLGRSKLRVSRQALTRGWALADEDGDETNSTLLLGNGPPSAGVTLRIVDPETAKPVQVMQIGEIWVDSRSKATGYFSNEEATAATFHARIDGDESGQTYLRTGDLGFLYDGEIFVTGRRKDLLIINGHNHYPQDLEETVRYCHPAVRPGGVIAFSLPDSGELESVGAIEQLVIVVEIRDGKQTDGEISALVEAVQQAVSRDHQLVCHAVVVGRRGTVLKTTSGKVQRSACRQAFIDGHYQTAAQTVRIEVANGIGDKAFLDKSAIDDQVADSLERLRNTGISPNERGRLLTEYLQLSIAGLMNVPSAQIAIDAPLQSLGLDSMMAIEMIYQIKQQFYLDIPIESFFEDASITTLARWLNQRLDAGATMEPQQTKVAEKDTLGNDEWVEVAL